MLRKMNSSRTKREIKGRKKEREQEEKKNAIKKKRKAFVDQEYCVACGCCVKVCPLGAIQIRQGVAAQVNLEKCVGCGKCAKECPASVIVIQEVEA